MLNANSTAVSKFHAPRACDERIQAVQERVRGLIRLGVWDIPISRFEGWMQRFTGPEELFLAACLLDSLIYRPERQFVPALASLLRGPVRWALGTALLPGNFDTDFTDVLASHAKLPVRLVPVIREDQPPTKSGPLILRQAKRELGIHNSWMVWPWQAAELLREGKIKGIVLIDDFLGSGTQLGKFLKAWNLVDAISQPDNVFCYAPVVAHEDGIKQVMHEYAQLRLVSAETLTHKHAFFSEHNWRRMTKGEVSGESARKYFKNWCAEHMRPPKSVPLDGFGHLELTVGFSHGTPNNTLPVFWQDAASGPPLLER